MSRSVALVIAVRGLAGEATAQSTTPAFEIATVRASGSDSAPMSLQRQAGGRLVTSKHPADLPQKLGVRH